MIPVPLLQFIESFGYVPQPFGGCGDTRASPCKYSHALVTWEERERGDFCVDAFPLPGVGSRCEFVLG